VKLAMTLLLRDNADIVEANLRYHLARGVDVVLVTDNGSRDGTVDIVDRYRGRGVAEIWHKHSSDFDQSAWVTRMARLAATEHAADWVINNDADELWWPKEGDLKQVFERIRPEYGRLIAPRTNFVARPDDSRHPFERMTFREVRPENVQGRLLPKTAHRGVPDIVVGPGCHNAYAPGLTVVPDQDPIHIFHYSRRSFAQFEQRIRNAAEIMKENPEVRSNATWAWREAYRHLRDGTLREFYEARVVSDQAAQARIAAGELMLDRRVSHFVRVNGLLEDNVPERSPRPSLPT
jgi:Glycosyl transferase family 2